MEKEKQPFHPDGMGLGTRWHMLVLQKVTCGSRSGSSSRVMAVACLCDVLEWSRAVKEHLTCPTCMWPEVADLSWEELLLLQKEAESGIKCETWEEINIPWQVSPTFFALPILKKEKLMGLGPSTSIYLGLSAPNLPYFERKLPTLLWFGVTVLCGTSSASSALAV